MRKSGANKLIKICYQKGRYGFCEPYTFDSVVELVEYYQKVSLSTCNTSLDVKLLYPLLRGHEDELANSQDLNSLILKFKEIQKRHTEKSKAYNELLKRNQLVESDIKHKKLALDAFQKAIILFKEQIELHKKYQKEAQPHEKSNLIENCDMLISRKDGLVKCHQDLAATLNQRVEQSKSIERDITSSKPDISDICQKLQQYMS